MQRVLPDLAQLLERYRDPFEEINTWGDAFIIVCTDP
jgi:hypothetical protein